MSKKRTIDSSITTFRVLEAFHDFEQAGVTEIANCLGLAKSTTHIHLNTLEEEGYLIKEGGKYTLSHRLLELSMKARNENALYKVAKSEVDKIASRTGELAGLVIEEQGKGVFLYRTEGKDAIHLDTYTGKRTYLHTTAPGKAILAHLPDEYRDEIIDRHGLPESTNQTITEYNSLMDELKEIRESTVAFSDGERINRLRSVAKPILGKGGNVVGAIGIGGPKSRLSDEQLRNRFPQILQEGVDVIQLNLEHSD